MNLSAGLGLFVVLGLAVGACGGGDDDDSADATTTSTTASTTTTLDPVAAEEAAVLEAYEQSWVRFIRAADPPDPDAAYLAESTAEPNLSHTRNILREMAAEGTSFRGAFETDARVTRLEGDAATVEDCGLDQIQMIGPSGEVLQEPNEDRDGWRAEMVREGGAWKLSSLDKADELCAER